MAVPAATPVTVPVLFTVATLVEPEVHDPPLTASVKEIVDPAHTAEVVPVIVPAPEEALTVTVFTDVPHSNE